MGPSDVEERVRAICSRFPGVTERLSHGRPAKLVRALDEGDGK